MSKKEISKEVLYEGVKMLVDCPDAHIHLPQQKLYTLFSLGFQYLLFMSTKDPGHYIIRVEDSYLLEKLQHKAKDEISRKFITRLALPRKLKYQNSTFHLDFFNFSTWNNTNDIPKEKIKAALVVKNASKKPVGFGFDDSEEDEQLKAIMASLPENYYIESLKEFVPKTITIAFDEELNGVTKINFPFIKEEPREKLAKGVSISDDVNFDDLDS